MLGKIFGVLALIALVFGILTGRMAEVGAGAMNGASKAVTLIISLAGAMCLWSGIMRVLERVGLTRALTRLIRPLLRVMYPALVRKGESGVLEDISANMSANLLGLGNAATPAGLRAMEKLSSMNVEPGRSSADMTMLVLSNCAAIQLVPTTLLSLRAAAGSANPAAVVVPVWICSAACFALTVALCRLFARKRR